MKSIKQLGTGNLPRVLVSCSFQDVSLVSCMLVSKLGSCTSLTRSRLWSSGKSLFCLDDIFEFFFWWLVFNMRLENNFQDLAKNITLFCFIRISGFSCPETV
jgi:hypothetical protein